MKIEYHSTGIDILQKENFHIVRNMSFQMKRIEDVFLTTKNGYGFVDSLQKVAQE